MPHGWPAAPWVHARSFSLEPVRLQAWGMAPTALTLVIEGSQSLMLGPLPCPRTSRAPRRPDLHCPRTWFHKELPSRHRALRAPMRTKRRGRTVLDRQTASDRVPRGYAPPSATTVGRPTAAPRAGVDFVNIGRRQGEGPPESILGPSDPWVKVSDAGAVAWSIAVEAASTPELLPPAVPSSSGTSLPPGRPSS